MAFPLPTHLPRKKDARDVSTQILTKISETSSKALNASLVSSWVAELDETIRVTKTRIHDRIHSDLPNFERQLASSISVQERLRLLSQNVDTLSENISNPQSGLIPSLVAALTTHSLLAQETADARAQHDAAAHLLKCRDELRNLTRLVEKAELADAKKQSLALERALGEAPEALSQSEVMADLKRRSSALRNRIEEHLLNAYSRSIVVSTTEASIRPTVQAVVSRKPVLAQTVESQDSAGTIIGLTDVLASMSPEALSMHLSTLRRDIIAHCIEYILKQPVQIYEAEKSDLTGAAEHKLSFARSPPDSGNLVSRLANLSTVMTFLHTHLFRHLPQPERHSFPLSLCNPIRTALLDHLLVPNLPSSLSRLPDFLRLAQDAVKLEDDIVVKILGDDVADRRIASWVDGVGMHYERKRRAEILDRVRVIVVTPSDDSDSFRVEVPLAVEEKVTTIQAEEKPATNGTVTEVAADGEDAWGFEDETPSQSEDSSGDGWGFDDEVEEPTPEPQAASEPLKPHEPPQVVVPVEEDPGDAWGWNDDTEPVEVEEESAWDDAWDEKPSVPVPEPVSPSPVPKPAKGLEKRFQGKSVPNSPAFPPPSPAVPAHPLASPPPAPVTTTNPPPPPALKPLQVNESYVVSGRTRELLRLVEDVLREGSELVASGILSGTPGNLIMQAAPMALELFRALVPVTNAELLKQSAKEPMKFSNDCTYVGHELGRIVKSLKGAEEGAKERLDDGAERLKVLADSFFEDAIAREEKLIDEILDNAQGFIDTTQQERYDECESAVNDVLQRIRRVAPQWKAVLTKSRYYDALGSVVEGALSRILGDVLALEDITEAESHQLRELCHILNALEYLFVEDPEQPSFVVSYVPSWLKFSYLSELLEASIADISYLFEEGALVDFEIEELVKLVKALFADTPLRTNTIHRLQQGHPARE